MFSSSARKSSDSSALCSAVYVPRTLNLGSVGFDHTMTLCSMELF